MDSLLISFAGSWIKDSSAGNKYMWGKVNLYDKDPTPDKIKAALQVLVDAGVSVMTFKNTRKTDGDNLPDYQIKLSIPDESGAVKDTFKGKEEDKDDVPF